eukprot:comp24332_c0_seq1/m.46026 comp24332_c0_seq1/g.46026  ORF comp24332_c0_seq1/g.46026 comp24332_c0_seq1/m.46026 type:complete len:166 (-) comp24332_c0_seq1:1689-2186(-)
MADGGAGLMKGAAPPEPGMDKKRSNGLRSNKIGNICSVPGCRGNYDDQNKVFVYKFPNPNDGRIKSETLREETRNLLSAWLRAVPRQWPETFAPHGVARVSCRHFPAHDIVKKGGKAWPRPGAVPSIFPNCPSYLSAPLARLLVRTRKREPQRWRRFGQGKRKRQ